LRFLFFIYNFNCVGVETSRRNACNQVVLNVSFALLRVGQSALQDWLDKLWKIEESPDFKRDLVRLAHEVICRF